MSSKKVFVWILSILVITAIVFFAGWESIKSVFLRVNIYSLLLLCLLQVVTLAMLTCKWHYLLKKLYNKISFSETFSIYLAGSFVESVTPSGRLGGEAAKVYLFRRHTSLPYRQLTAILLVDKYLSLLAFAVLCILFLSLSIFGLELPSAVYFALPALCIFVIAMLRFYNPESCQGEDKVVPEAKRDLSTPSSKKISLETLIIEKIKGIHAFWGYSARYSRQLVTAGERHQLLLLSFFIWILYPLKIYTAASILGFDVGIVFVAIATYATYLVSTIPLLPGGLGFFEGTMAFMFTYTGLSFAEGLAIALLARLGTYWFPLFLSAVATVYLTYRADKIGKPSGSTGLALVN